MDHKFCEYQNLILFTAEASVPRSVSIIYMLQEGVKERRKEWRNEEKDHAVLTPKMVHSLFTVSLNDTVTCPVGQVTNPAIIFALLLLKPYTTSQHLDLSILPSISLSHGFPSLCPHSSQTFICLFIICLLSTKQWSLLSED